MLRLRGHLLSAVRAAPPLPATSSLPFHRLFLYSTTPASHFVVEDYLTSSCGLAPEQARRVSRYLPGLKSPNNADAVLAFLAGIGVSKADVATAISWDPRFLCTNVDTTLTPRIAQLRDFGLSPPQISRLISIAPNILVSPSWIARLPFYLSLLGSYHNLHTVLRSSRYLLGLNLERVVKPNMAFLQQCGLTDSDIAKLLFRTPRLFASETVRLKEIAVCADMLGVPRSSAMFKYALMSIYRISPAKINARSDSLKKALGFSEAELGIALRRQPEILNFSESRLSCVVDFLKTEVGLDSEYMARRPALFTYSLPKRLMPRHYVLKTLKAKGLLEKDVDSFTAVTPKGEVFTKRFLDPYKDTVPGLANAYAAACAGQVPVVQP